MYIEPLMPWAEMIVLSLMMIAVAVYKYVCYRKGSKYSYRVQQFLRSSNRVIYTWSSDDPAPKIKRRRSKTIYIGTSNGVPVYIKEADL